MLTISGVNEFYSAAAQVLAVLALAFIFDSGLWDEPRGMRSRHRLMVDLFALFAFVTGEVVALNAIRTREDSLLRQTIVGGALLALAAALLIPLAFRLAGDFLARLTRRQKRAVRLLIGLAVVGFLSGI